jgi:hypothetical protein
MTIKTNPTLSELVYAILNTVRARTTSSEIITEEIVKFHIKNVRAQLIKQDANKGYTADSYIIQDLGCVELELADAAECCTIDAGCKTLRTVLPIPSLIELHHGQLLTRVGPVNKMDIPFDIVPFERVPYLVNKFTNKRIRAYNQNNGGHIYLTIPESKVSLMKRINIQGVFEDPEEVAKFKTCDEAACYSDDSPFPIKAWMVPVLMQLVIEMFIGKQSVAPTDLTNNAKTDLSTQQEGN